MATRGEDLAEFAQKWAARLVRECPDEVEVIVVVRGGGRLAGAGSSPWERQSKKDPLTPMSDESIEGTLRAYLGERP